MSMRGGGGGIWGLRPPACRMEQASPPSSRPQRGLAMPSLNLPPPWRALTLELALKEVLLMPSLKPFSLADSSAASCVNPTKLTCTREGGEGGQQQPEQGPQTYLASMLAPLEQERFDTVPAVQP